ncbi:unnamed protein product [Fraxinus pennsylvanica]|uniref:SMP-LTD domain-containing protein n=1 Tax=Fraxinus pennsylvanica TaxID=56036 RepID=A0AAD1ZNW5_9LAMI|nr:unnamed protein product [Fraxinus pennsylvanica]
MGFLVGYVLGVAVGIGLIIGFARYQNIRSKGRTDLAEAIAAFARMTVDDSRKILPNELYPSWLTWLNQHLEKIWPYVNEAASQLIRTSVEPTLEAYRPIIFASLKFSKLTLGTVAPKFTGVSIIEGDPGEIIMELELQWDGNPNIGLDVKTRVGVGLPVQVKNIAFTGVFRIIFKPLVDEFPCFGAVCYSLREKKNLDFTLKVVGGDVSAIPGISDALEGTIRDAIEDSITWPVRKIIPILPGDYRHDVSLYEGTTLYTATPEFPSADMMCLRSRVQRHTVGPLAAYLRARGRRHDVPPFSCMEARSHYLSSVPLCTRVEARRASILLH